MDTLYPCYYQNNQCQNPLHLTELFLNLIKILISIYKHANLVHKPFHHYGGIKKITVLSKEIIAININNIILKTYLQ